MTPRIVIRLLLLLAGPSLLIVGATRVAAQDDVCYSAPIRDANHRFAQGVCSWKTLKNENIVMQQRDYSCGAATLATVIRYYWGDDVTELMFLVALDKLLTQEELIDRVKNGLAISDLRRVAVQEGYLATIGSLTWDKLSESKVPLVVPIKTRGHDHFVVYRGTDGDRVFLADPIRGNIRMFIPQFLHEWQKNAVLVVAKPNTKLPVDAPLELTDADYYFGETNYQLLRTQDKVYHFNSRLRPR